MHDASSYTTSIAALVSSPRTMGGDVFFHADEAVPPRRRWTDDLDEVPKDRLNTLKLGRDRAKVAWNTLRNSDTADADQS
jgi:hypothetical protein